MQRRARARLILRALQRLSFIGSTCTRGSTTTLVYRHVATGSNTRRIGWVHLTDPADPLGPSSAGQELFQLLHPQNMHGPSFRSKRTKIWRIGLLLTSLTDAACADPLSANRFHFNKALFTIRRSFDQMITPFLWTLFFTENCFSSN